MAFDAKGWKLEPAGGVCGSTGQYRHTHAKYITLDAAAVVEGAGYFNAIYQNAPVGTVIDAVMDIAGTPVNKRYIVTASSSSGVTVALQSASAG